MNERLLFAHVVPRAMPVPVMLQMLQLIEHQTHDDVVLSGVARTVSQAIDELSALQRTALEVVREMDEQAIEHVPKKVIERRRLC